MRKYITRDRVFSSNSTSKSPTNTSQNSLFKLKQRTPSGNTLYGNPTYKERVNEQYMVRDNRKMGVNPKNNEKTSDFKRRRKQSLDSINRDIKFENQLKEEIKALNLTLLECKHLQNDLIKQKNPESRLTITDNKASNLRFGKQSRLVPQNFKQLVQLEQRIRNRQKQIKSVTEIILQLKEDNWNLNARKEPLQQLILDQPNTKMQRFILADEMSELNLLLKQKVGEYKKKYNDLKILKTSVDNVFKDNQEQYELKVKNSLNVGKSFPQKPISYQEFKQNKKKNTQKSKNDLNRVKSLQSIIPSSKNHFSNISNVSAILPNNFFVEQWLNRQLLPGEIPSLPKQYNPTIKSMNTKKKVLKQAIQSLKLKHDKLLSQIIDKLLFLREQEAFLTKQVQNHETQMTGLEAKFSSIESKPKIQTITTIKSNQIPQNCKRKLSEESSLNLAIKTPLKNYTEENLLLENTGNNSSILDQTGKILKFP